ncbi:MAG: hypothetical protein OQJ77_04585 [Thiovulaceae bacterium]|nr:hypothetical protein [Sulfurimonadaceae bacterium]MCW9026573.1 hypothetical protein [Sulfurimonadaceae bacterium]
MGEPRLEDIGDYDTLKGEKKKVVWAVILAGLTIGVIYSIAYNMYDNKDENIAQDKSYRVAPMK